MEIKFGKKYLADVYEGKVHKYKDYKSNPSLVRQYVKTVKRLYATGSTEELKKQRALNFEKLRGDLKAFAQFESINNFGCCSRWLKRRLQQNMKF